MLDFHVSLSVKARLVSSINGSSLHHWMPSRVCLLHRKFLFYIFFLYFRQRWWCNNRMDTWDMKKRNITGTVKNETFTINFTKMKQMLTHTHKWFNFLFCVHEKNNTKVNTHLILQSIIAIMTYFSFLIRVTTFSHTLEISTDRHRARCSIGSDFNFFFLFFSSSPYDFFFCSSFASFTSSAFSATMNKSQRGWT